MSEVDEREERFLDALEQLDDNVLQHEYILSFASCLDMLASEECTDENALAGCTADAWLELRKDDAGGIAMRGASDALIVRGLLGAVSEMIAGVPATDIARWHPRLIRETRVGRQLFAQRRRGLASFAERIVEYAAKLVEESNSRQGT